MREKGYFAPELTFYCLFIGDVITLSEGEKDVLGEDIGDWG